MLRATIDRLLTPERKRFVKFAIVGSSGVVVNLFFVWLALTAFEAWSFACAEVEAWLQCEVVLDPAQMDSCADNCWPSNTQKALASAFGIFVSVFTNFLLNNAWTWADRDKGVRKRDFAWRVARYYVASAVAIAIQYGTAMGFVALWSTGGSNATDLYVGQLAGIALGTVVNYAINNVWTFRDESDPDAKGLRKRLIGIFRRD